MPPLLGELFLKHTAEKALLDHITVLPSIITRAATPENVTKGFTLNGTVDVKTKAWPDFNAILKTCRRTISKEEEKLCKDKFAELYKYACEYGNIPDEKWYQLGFPVDKNSKGEDVLRNVGISCENHQRAKHLSHLVE